MLTENRKRAISNVWLAKQYLLDARHKRRNQGWTGADIATDLKYAQAARIFAAMYFNADRERKAA